MRQLVCFSFGWYFIQASAKKGFGNDKDKYGVYLGYSDTVFLPSFISPVAGGTEGESQDVITFLSGENKVK